MLGTCWIWICAQHVADTVRPCQVQETEQNILGHGRNTVWVLSKVVQPKNEKLMHFETCEARDSTTFLYHSLPPFWSSQSWVLFLVSLYHKEKEKFDAEVRQYATTKLNKDSVVEGRRHKISVLFSQ